MSNSSVTEPTQFLQTPKEKYAYRRFGKKSKYPLLCLQHFTGTLDNWDPAVTDPLALAREVILFENAGVGRSTGEVPQTISEMAAHALAFVEALGIKQIDILGYSLGGMVAQQIALDRPSLVRRMILVGTAPEGGEDIMHMEKPELKKITDDPNIPGLQKLVKLFFAPSNSSQAAGEAFVARLAQRTSDREPVAGPKVAMAQITAFRQNNPAVSGRERNLRQYDSGQKFVHAERTLTERDACNLSRRWPRFTLSISQLVRDFGFVISGLGEILS
jgi:pimeloyl-ACP methyl ester carboxylesterase